MPYPKPVHGAIENCARIHYTGDYEQNKNYGSQPDKVLSFVLHTVISHINPDSSLCDFSLGDHFPYNVIAFESAAVKTTDDTHAVA